jgi:hypothetical protein
MVDKYVKHTPMMRDIRCPNSRCRQVNENVRLAKNRSGGVKMASGRICVQVRKQVPIPTVIKWGASPRARASRNVRWIKKNRARLGRCQCWLAYIQPPRNQNGFVLAAIVPLGRGEGAARPKSCVSAGRKIWENMRSISCSSRGDCREEIPTLPTQADFRLLEALFRLQFTEAILKIKYAGRGVEGPAPHRTAGLEYFQNTPVGHIKKFTPQTQRPTGFLQTDSSCITY